MVKKILNTKFKCEVCEKMYDDDSGATKCERDCTKYENMKIGSWWYEDEYNCLNKDSFFIYLYNITDKLQTIDKTEYIFTRYHLYKCGCNIQFDIETNLVIPKHIIIRNIKKLSNPKKKELIDKMLYNINEIY